MAKSISDIANGKGYVYVTQPDGTTVVDNIPNTCYNYRTQVKPLGVQAASVSANLIAMGTITVNTNTSGSGNVTDITVATITQIGIAIPVGGVSTSETATLIRDGINSHVATSGVNYTATAKDSIVTLFSTASAGNTVNGDAVVAGSDDPSNITFTTTAISGGTSANVVYDETCGLRFFLDADYAAAASSCSGEGTAVQGNLTNAIEVTDYLVMQGVQSSVKTQELTISGGVIAPERTASRMIIDVDTQASAATDNLDTINAKDVAAGDQIILRGQSAARVTTLTALGNITLSAGSFSTGAESVSIMLEYRGESSSWVELSRSSVGVPSVTNFRASSFPFLSTYGKDTIALATSGTVTLTVNTDEQYQAITGSATLAGMFKVDLSTVGAVAGDVFVLHWQATAVIGAHTLVLGATELTAAQANGGGMFIISNHYNGSAWDSYLMPDMQAGTWKLEAANIAAGLIATAKLASDLQQEVLTVPLSFETGEIGAYRIEMPYPGSIVKISSYVTKLIEATDNGSITVTDDSSATMSTITMPGGTAIGTGVTSAPTTNNTFVATDVLTFTTTKVTVGGKVLLTLKITRS